MVTLKINDVASILKEYYRQELKDLFLQSWEFEQKYGKAFENFEKQINQAKEEDFTAWDDYMEWKACQKTLKDRKIKFQALKNGDFTVVA